MIKNLRTFWYVLQLNMRQAFYYKGGAVGVTLTWALRVGITVLTYNSIYKLIGADAVRGISLDVAISGMLFFAVFSIVSGRELPRRMTADYKAGSIEVWFAKPIPYLLFKLGEIIGKNIPAFIGIVVTSLIYWSVFQEVSHHHEMVWRVLSAVILLFFGTLISILLFMLVALSSIFLVDAKAINYVVDKMIMLFGGIYIPIGFFPDTFRAIGEALPTTAATYGSQFLYPDFFDHLSRFIIMQCVWLIILYVAVLRLNNKAQKHLTVNGG